MAKFVRLQQGEITFPAVSSPQTITVSSYILAQSFCWFVSRGGTASDPDFNSMDIAKATTTTLVMNRTNTGSTNSHTVRWFLAEFDSAVSVQDISETGAGDTTEAISAVTLANTWAFNAGSRTSGSIWSADDCVELTFDSTTVLRSHGGSATINREHQVVDFGADASVQQVAPSITGTSTTSTISSVEPSRSQVWATGFPLNLSPANLNPENVWRVGIGSATTLQHDRAVSTKTGSNPYTNQSIFVVEFAKNMRVQRGTRTFSSSQTNETVTISPVHTANTAIRFPSHPHSQQNSYTSDDTSEDFSTSTYTGEFDDTTTLRVQRAATGSVAADAPWEISDWTVPARAFRNPALRNNLIRR